MKKTLMGITKALFTQNMGKSCDEMNFCRSRVQWLRDTALEELFPRAVLAVKRKDADSAVCSVLAGHPGAPFPCAVFQFFVHWKGKKWSLPYMGALLCTLCPGDADIALGTLVEEYI